jgi:nitrite reductase/ring-hydroxylating ferredoxin subunit
MTMQAGWHPVALSVSVEPGTSAGARLAGNELVVWRDNGGAAHVWEDRCPHRGMKLSFGFVRGDHIACLYHGWQYDTAGQCRYVPAHPDLKVPTTITATVYSTLEAAGMIWTAPDQEAGPPGLPDLPDEVVAVRSLYLDSPAGAVIEAVKTMPPAPFSEGPGAASLAALSETLFSLTVGGDRLLLGLQDLSGGRSALHVVIDGPAARYAGIGQAHFLAWTAELRHRLAAERGAGATAMTRAA